MGVLLARARREVHSAVANRIVDQFVVGEGAKRLSQIQLHEVVHRHIVNVAGSVGHEHSHRHLIGGQEVREPAGDLFVQADASLLNQHQQQGGHEGFCDSADAIVHVRGGRHGGHRGAEGGGDHLPVGDPHAKHDRLRAGRLGPCVDDGLQSIRICVGRGDGLADRSLWSNNAQDENQGKQAFRFQRHSSNRQNGMEKTCGVQPARMDIVPTHLEFRQGWWIAGHRFLRRFESLPRISGRVSDIVLSKKRADLPSVEAWFGRWRVSRSQWNEAFRVDSGASRGGNCRRAIRPIEASNDPPTSALRPIVLKNSEIEPPLKSRLRGRRVNSADGPHGRAYRRHRRRQTRSVRRPPKEIPSRLPAVF